MATEAETALGPIRVKGACELRGRQSGGPRYSAIGLRTIGPRLAWLA